MWGGVCMIWDINFPYILLDFLLDVRTYYCATICLIFFKIVFSPPKAHLPFSNRGKNIKKSRKVQFLQNPQSLFAFLGPLATHDQKNVFFNLIFDTGIKTEFWNSFDKFKVASFAENSNYKKILIFLKEEKQHNQDSNVSVSNLEKTMK